MLGGGGRGLLAAARLNVGRGIVLPEVRAGMLLMPNKGLYAAVPKVGAGIVLAASWLPCSVC